MFLCVPYLMEVSCEIEKAWYRDCRIETIVHSKIHGANMRPTFVLLASDGPHVGPMNLSIRDVTLSTTLQSHFREKISMKFAVAL